MPNDKQEDVVVAAYEWKKGFPTLDGDYYSRVDEYDKQPTAIRIESTSQTAAAVYEFGCEKDLRREYESEEYEYLGPIDAPALCATVRALRRLLEIQSRESDRDLTTTQRVIADNTALRERLAQAGQGLKASCEIRVAAERIISGLQYELAQVTAERDRLLTALTDVDNPDWKRSRP